MLIESDDSCILMQSKMGLPGGLDSVRSIRKVLDA